MVVLKSLVQRFLVANGLKLAHETPFCILFWSFQGLFLENAGHRGIGMDVCPWISLLPLKIILFIVSEIKRFILPLFGHHFVRKFPLIFKINQDLIK